VVYTAVCLCHVIFTLVSHTRLFLAKYSYTPQMGFENFKGKLSYRFVICGWILAIEHCGLQCNFIWTNVWAWHAETYHTESEIPNFPISLLTLELMLSIFFSVSYIGYSVVDFRNTKAKHLLLIRAGFWGDFIGHWHSILRARAVAVHNAPEDTSKTSIGVFTAVLGRL
jgi:hypothetical protein